MKIYSSFWPLCKISPVYLVTWSVKPRHFCLFAFIYPEHYPPILFIIARRPRTVLSHIIHLVLTLNSFPYGGLPFPEICRLHFRACCVKWDLYVALPWFEFRFRLYLTRNTWSAAVPLLSSGFRLDLSILLCILFNLSVKDLWVNVL